MITIESYLLLVLLLITAVALFICILNALYLWDFEKQINKVKKSSLDFQVKKESKGDLPGLPASIPDLSLGLEFISKKYQLDSLIISTLDGLLVASYGSKNPEYEAAYYSYKLGEEKMISDGGMRVFKLDDKMMPLIVILFAGATPPNEIVPQVKIAVKSLFETQF